MRADGTASVQVASDARALRRRSRCRPACGFPAACRIAVPPMANPPPASRSVDRDTDQWRPAGRDPAPHAGVVYVPRGFLPPLAPHGGFVLRLLIGRNGSAGRCGFLARRVVGAHQCRWLAVPGQAANSCALLAAPSSSALVADDWNRMPKHQRPIRRGQDVNSGVHASL